MRVATRAGIYAAPVRAIEVAAADDPRLADFRRLNDSAFRRSVESPTTFGRGIFVAEGWLALQRAVESRQQLRAILVDDARKDRLAPILDTSSAHGSVQVFSAQRSVIAEVVGFDLHRGVVATADRRLPAMPDAVAARADRLVLVEGVNDGENLGSLFRTAAAFGVGGVLLDPSCPDPLSRRCIRVSMGHALRVPWAIARTSDWSTRLRDDGVMVVALTPGGDVPLDEVGVGTDERVAVVVGAEGPGLGPAALDAASIRVRIPMSSGTDSLNVATAAGVALWHLRQSHADR